MTLAAAIRSGDVTLLPSRRDEDWRWTDLRGLLRTLPTPSPETDAAVAPGPFGALGDSEILVVNGRLRDDAASTLTVRSGEKRTVRLRFVSASPQSRHEARLTINVHMGADLTLLESHEGMAEGYVAASGLDIRVDDGARVERLVIAADDADAVNVSQAEVVLAAGARFSQTVLTDGAKRQRLETRLTHPGDKADVHLDGVYLIGGRGHADLTTSVHHQGPGGTTEQLTKGVVRDQARAVFQGRIVVARGADQTEARMGHHALILSDRAEVDAKPELEIYADDVSCAHGNTVGALDEDALFYAQQRGVPYDEARAMLAEAFVSQVVERIEHEGARAICAAWAAARVKI
ncbi:Fe-S cluster assembly protein SufD [Phenylobacterium sp.]|uniref:Fe-S cluster assembly protein SufD n=1 Tax=Phenylobacterium sp. TaxID=1871053 RepID=UPI0027360BB9|nr:Fe-S cluster assembly protein SufD [Phenylobacterium sp.]MDP3658742.1 Fe-S cluster assembly protein SufD [Phenylobacterium sp.]